MATLTEYNNNVRESDSDIIEELDEFEAVSHIIDAIVERRKERGLSLRELASLCGLPHSSLSRLESRKSMPNLRTLLKVCKQLDLSLVVEPTNTTDRPE